MTGRRAALASPIRLNATATRRSAATTSGRRSSSSDGSPGRHLAGEAGQLRRDGRRSRGIAAEQELERSNRLRTSQLELAQDVAIAPDARRAPRTHPLDCRRRRALVRRPGARAPRSPEWSRAPLRPASRLRSRGTSSWPRGRQSTRARIRNPLAPTRLARSSRPGRSARGPRGRASQVTVSRAPWIPELSPDNLPPPRASKSTDGYSFAPASLA